MSRFTLAMAVAVCVVLITFATIASAQEEINAIQQQQSQGFLERIMSDYVYPLRDYDWRGMVRRVLNDVMDYITPDAKEPKLGGFEHTSAQERTAVRNPEDALEMSIYNGNDVARPLGSLIAKWVINKANDGLTGGSDEGVSPTVAVEDLSLQSSGTANSEDPLSKLINSDTALTQVKSSARLANLNSNIANDVAIASWSYLGTLVAYGIISIAAAVIPALKYSPEDPLL